MKDLANLSSVGHGYFDHMYSIVYENITLVLRDRLFLRVLSLRTVSTVNVSVS